jgi:hypothetical protein
MTEMRVCLTRGVAIAATVTLTSIAMAQGGDTIATATPLAIGNNAGTTVGYINDYDEICPYSGSTSPDVVYYYTPTADASLTLDLCVGTTNYDTKIYVYDSSGGPPNVGCNDDACSSPLYSSFVSLLSVAVDAGETYYIIVDGYGLSSGNYTLAASLGPPPPPPLGCPPGTIYGQRPYTPDESWTFGTSDLNPGYKRFDNFPGDLGGEICDLHWFGAMLDYSLDWADCVEIPMTFEIGFWNDDGTGYPDLTAPVYLANHVVAAVPTGRMFAVVYTEYSWTTVFDPCIDMPNGGWVSIQGVSDPANCWFMWLGSPEGDARSLYDSAGIWTTEVFDLSMCLTGVVGAQFMYLDCPELWDAFNGTGELPISSLICTVWHVIWPADLHCWYLHIYDVDDTGGTVPGYLDVCDYIALEDNSTQEDLGWWHIENITITITVTFGSNTMYLDWAGPLSPWPGWWSGIWHELYPNFCTNYDAYYYDNGAAGLDVGDEFLIGDNIWVVVEIGVDITVSQEVEPPTGRCCVNYDEQCYDGDTEAECYARPGYYWHFLADGTCADDPCPMEPTGACCVGTDCVDTNTMSECDGLGGDWYLGETCPDFDCPMPLECPEDSIFDQRPCPIDGAWTAATSDAGPGYKVYDDYVVDVPVCDIHWFGLSLFYSAGWTPCETEDPMTFLIEFWPDNGAGAPDTTMPAVCSYSMDIARYNTGSAPAGYPLYYYAADLDPCCEQLAGWVSIQSTSVGVPDCWFLWWNSDVPGTAYQEGAEPPQVAYNMSLCLTPGAACPASDLNGDCCVNVSDLLILLGNWGTNGNGAQLADPIDIVNVSDLLFLLGEWGQGSGCP